MYLVLLCLLSGQNISGHQFLRIKNIVKAITDPESVQIKDVIPLIAMTLLSAIFVIILIVNFVSLIFSKIF